LSEFSKESLSGEFYKTLLDSLFDAVYTVDQSGQVTYWNQSCVRLTGYQSDEVIGHDLRDSCFVQDENSRKEDQRRGVDIVLETGMPGTWKGYIRRKNGQRIPVESHLSAIRDGDGNITGAVEVLRDISALQSLETAHRQLLQMSRKDQLTGLYNRAAISEFLKAEIERSRRYQQPMSAVMVDIDHFKRVNDQYGHDAGDKVLSKVAAVLGHNLRKPDVVGRWGGEEFLLLVPGSDARAAEKLSERLRQQLKEIPESEIAAPITACFGVAELETEQSLDELLYVADMALYEAKRLGRDRVIIGKREPSEAALKNEKN